MRKRVGGAQVAAAVRPQVDAVSRAPDPMRCRSRTGNVGGGRQRQNPSHCLVRSRPLLRKRRRTGTPPKSQRRRSPVGQIAAVSVRNVARQVGEDHEGGRRRFGLGGVLELDRTAPNVWRRPPDRQLLDRFVDLGSSDARSAAGPPRPRPSPAPCGRAGRSAPRRTERARRSETAPAAALPVRVPGRCARP